MLLLQQPCACFQSWHNTVCIVFVQAAQWASPLHAPGISLHFPSSPQEALLRRLLQRSQYSAAVVQMRMAVHLAGFTLPGPA